MISEAPPFWWKKADWRAWALLPASVAYAWVARRRLLTAPRTPVDAPVLCVGNLTVGGSGKTPVAIALAKEAAAIGLKPGFLSRGHGGSVGKPHLVDPHHDLARHVGDEPLLLARAAPVAVTADRAAGANLLLADGCDFIIMDDGFQSARVHIDYALIVIDARRGVGNGHTIPGGPLRGTLVDQMRYVHGVVRMGEGEAGERVVRNAARAGRPVFDAHVRATSPEGIAGARCLAFAGIGDPRKFFDTARALGADIVVERTFGDHHAYSDFDVQDLVSTADEQGLTILTTAKDAVRLEHGTETMTTMRARLKVVEIEAVFEPASSARAIIEQTREAWRRRRLAGGWASPPP
jgi:tetraacyldisaccharide 4'-kinase